MIAASDNETPVSSASAWQINTKHQFGKRLRAGDVPTRLPAYLHKARTLVLTISAEDAIVAGNLPERHQDSFDRMLIARAPGENTCHTPDPVFKSHGMHVCW